MPPAQSNIALIVVDMQNAYCHQNGSLSREGWDTSACRNIVGNVKQIIDMSRKASLPVIFLYIAFQENYEDGGIMIHQIWPFYKEKRGLINGTWDAEIIDGLKPLPGDTVIRKTRYSGFSGTNLDYILRYRGIDTLVFTGVTTSICVESTLRDAHHLGYRVAILSDATAEIDDYRHEASLKTIECGFGRVLDISQYRSFLNEID